MSNIAENIIRVRERMQKAAGRAGRELSSIKLVAVTKTAAVEQIEEAFRCGIEDFGENRLQTAEPKILALSLQKSVSWHMIGHLQTNKVKKALGLFCLIHGLDSLKLARKIDEEAGKKGLVFPVFMEVNISEEATKFGMKPQDAKVFLVQCRALPNIKVQGLMVMAPYSPDPEAARPHFKKAALLKKELGLEYLSMGMSGDFETAIEEGSDMVRIGTAIFGT
ncbi:MAG: YggS family pyridoxal phosphate-dependent enzyme [Candidatus Margulisiibacteriota bacterium]